MWLETRIGRQRCMGGKMEGGDNGGWDTVREAERHEGKEEVAWVWVESRIGRQVCLGGKMVIMGVGSSLRWAIFTLHN